MLLYASEMIRVLLHREAKPDCVPPPFCLLDDAARAIHSLPKPTSPPDLPFGIDAEQREALVSDYVTSLIDLNLTLPPDPNAKHAPATLDGAGSGDIALGWEKELDGEQPSSSGGASAVPGEISRVLAQSPECLGWNAALSMYILGMDLSVVYKDGFQLALAKWRRRKEQAKVLIALDVLNRASKLLGAGCGQ